jgi:regulator of replication initiation timing
VDGIIRKNLQKVNTRDFYFSLNTYRIRHILENIYLIKKRIRETGISSGMVGWKMEAEILYNNKPGLFKMYDKLFHICNNH